MWFKVRVKNYGSPAGLGRGVRGKSVELRKVYDLRLALESRVCSQIRLRGSMVEFRVQEILWFRVRVRVKGPPPF